MNRRHRTESPPLLAASFGQSPLERAEPSGLQQDVLLSSCRSKNAPNAFSDEGVAAAPHITNDTTSTATKQHDDNVDSPFLKPTPPTFQEEAEPGSAVMNLLLRADQGREGREETPKLHGDRVDCLIANDADCLPHGRALPLDYRRNENEQQQHDERKQTLRRRGQRGVDEERGSRDFGGEERHLSTTPASATMLPGSIDVHPDQKLVRHPTRRTVRIPLVVEEGSHEESLEHLSGGSSSRSNAGQRRRRTNEREDESIPRPSIPVDFVHHDSPVGPAISIYPRGYDWRCKHGGEVEEIAGIAHDGDHDGHGGNPHHQQVESYPQLLARQSSAPTRMRLTGEDCESSFVPARRRVISRSASMEDRSPLLGHCSQQHQPQMPSPPRHSNMIATTRESASLHDDRYLDRNVPLRIPLDRPGSSSPLLASHQVPVMGPRPLQQPKVTMVEISPGVQVPLRGAQETQEYVRQGWITFFTCCVCSLDMFCIMDASFIMCPSCRVVNPFLLDKNVGAGLGLGFTADELDRMLH
uniref:Uncharacterized protein n=1 Tax=Entomoneis paludosa TaxID=265537 RepID=A0A7S3DR05_9STRA|mmetsp:Transcript_29402/g.61487  ORF Transcript_29402/g.61487 Transcript_29402/m.61487 type:complete len:527 (+) Transcript_29402:172-1752(+)